MSSHAAGRPGCSPGRSGTPPGPGGGESWPTATHVPSGPPTAWKPSPVISDESTRPALLGTWAEPSQGQCWSPPTARCWMSGRSARSATANEARTTSSTGSASWARPTRGSGGVRRQMAGPSAAHGRGVPAPPARQAPLRVPDRHPHRPAGPAPATPPAAPEPPGLSQDPLLRGQRPAEAGRTSPTAPADPAPAGDLDLQRPEGDKEPRDPLHTRREGEVLVVATPAEGRLVDLEVLGRAPTIHLRGSRPTRSRSICADAAVTRCPDADRHTPSAGSDTVSRSGTARWEVPASVNALSPTAGCEITRSPTRADPSRTSGRPITAELHTLPSAPGPTPSTVTTTAVSQQGSGSVDRKRSAGDVEVVADVGDAKAPPGGVEHGVMLGPGADVAGQGHRAITDGHGDVAVVRDQ